MIEVASVGPKGASRTDLPGSLFLMAPGASGPAFRAGRVSGQARSRPDPQPRARIDIGFIDQDRRGAAIAVRFAVEALLDAAITDKMK